MSKEVLTSYESPELLQRYGKGAVARRLLRGITKTGLESLKSYDSPWEGQLGSCKINRGGRFYLPTIPLS